MTDQQTEQMIQAKGLTAPRVTPQDVENEIASAHFFSAADGIIGKAGGVWGHMSNHPVEGQDPLSFGDGSPLPLLTFCVLVLKNGFTVTGESACASPENFDAEIGRKIARQKAIEKVWPLLGFRLRDKLAAQPADWRERVLQEKAALDEKIEALGGFLASPKFDELAQDERNRLSDQLDTMQDYSELLHRRITSWQMPKAE